MKNPLLTAVLCLSFLSAAVNAETIVSGDVFGVWNLQGSPYIARENIRVPNNRVLQIQPGVRVYLSGAAQMLVYGKLEAIGTANDSIYFGQDPEAEHWGGLRLLDADSLTMLQYCIFENGYVSQGRGFGDSLSSGGNIFIWRGNVAIRNSRISRGQARGSGGGIAIWRSSPLIENCLVNENTGPENGGGIEIIYESSPRIIGCQFVDNHTNWAGGGVCVESHSNPTFEQCVFFSNSASGFGGAFGLYSGSSPVVRECQFLENNAAGGGAMYLRNEGSRPLVDWCLFVRNVANQGDARTGGAILIRENCAAEVRYCRFLENQAGTGGAVAFWDQPLSLFHNNLLVRNMANSGGAIATSGNFQQNNLFIDNCTMIDNRGGNEGGTTALVREGSFVWFNSCIILGQAPLLWHSNRITVTYTNISGGWNGIGNTDVDPEFFALDTTWFMLNGNSPCVDSGDPDRPQDPDNTTVDKGWLHFPHNAWDGMAVDTLAMVMDAGSRESAVLQFCNTTSVPIFVSPMDNWRDGGRNIEVNATAITRDTEIHGATFTNDNFYLTGGNSGENPNQMYELNRNFSLTFQYEQPGGADDDGYFDLASDGFRILYGGDEIAVVEFSTHDELGNVYNNPADYAHYHALTADYKFNEDGFGDIYMAGDEREIARAGDEMIVQQRYPLPTEVYSLAMKGNVRAMYAIIRPQPPQGPPRDAIDVLALFYPDDNELIPLYPLRLDQGYTVGGIEITHDWQDGRGTLIGVLEGDDDHDDKLFIQDLYTSWLAIKPSWKLLMPGQEAEWDVLFAADEVEAGDHTSTFYLVVNGYGQGGEVRARLNSTGQTIDRPDIIVPEELNLSPVYPNPFNSRSSFSYTLPRNMAYELRVVNIQGQRVEVLSGGIRAAGTYNFVLDGGRYPSGNYFIELRTNIGSRTTGFSVVK